MAYELRASLEAITPRLNHTRPVMAVCAEHDQPYDSSKLWFWRPRKEASTGYDHLCAFLGEQFPKDDPYFKFRSTLIPKSAQKDRHTASAFVETSLRQEFKMRRAGDRGIQCSCGESSCAPTVQVIAVGYDVFGMLTGMTMHYKQFKKFCHGYLYEEAGQKAPLKSPHITVKHELIPLVNPCLLDFSDSIARESFERALAIVTL